MCHYYVPLFIGPCHFVYDEIWAISGEIEYPRLPVSQIHLTQYTHSKKKLLACSTWILKKWTGTFFGQCSSLWVFQRTPWPPCTPLGTQIGCSSSSEEFLFLTSVSQYFLWSICTHFDWYTDLVYRGPTYVPYPTCHIIECSYLDILSPDHTSGTFSI